MKFYYRVPSDSTGESDDRSLRGLNSDTRKFITEDEVVSWFKDLYATPVEKEIENAAC